MNGDTRTGRRPRKAARRRQYRRPTIATHSFGSVVQSGTGPELEGASGMQKRAMLPLSSSG